MNSNFLGGPPLRVFIKLVILSLVLGAVLVWLDLSPLNLARGLERLVRSILDMGFDAFREAGRFILTGAIIVVPLFLLFRLVKSARR